MANKLVRNSEITHCSNVSDYYPDPPHLVEVDKGKSISDMSRMELRQLIDRLRDEREAEDIVRQLRRSAGERDTGEAPAKINTITPINQLYHHGILGMKWGVRRFQREDGSRTAAGKRREAARDYPRSIDHTTSREQKQKAPEGLSNEELRKLNERLQLEATYKNLTTEKIQKSESFVTKAIKTAAEGALTEFAKGAFIGSAKLLVKELSPSFAEVAFNMKDKK